MKKVLICLTSCDQLNGDDNKTGYHLAEVTHPYFKFIEEGYEVEFLSPKGGKAPLDESSRDMSDPLNKRFFEISGIQSQLNHTCNPNQVKALEYDAIYFAGGHGTMGDFPTDMDLARVTSEIYENGGVVGGVCHGPAAFVNVKLSDGSYLVAGHDISSFTDEEEVIAGKDKVVPFLLEKRLKERGAKHTKAAPFQRHALVSGRLVTGQNPASASKVGELIVELLRQQTAVNNVEVAS